MSKITNGNGSNAGKNRRQKETTCDTEKMDDTLGKRGSINKDSGESRNLKQKVNKSFSRSIRVLCLVWVGIHLF